MNSYFLKTNHKSKAFTLIELLVVILIIALLIVVAAPSFLGHQNKANDSASQQKLAVVHKEIKASYVGNQESFLPIGTMTTQNTLLYEMKESEPHLNFIEYVEGTAEADINTVSVTRHNKDMVTACIKSNSKRYFCFRHDETASLNPIASNSFESAAQAKEITVKSTGATEKDARCLLDVASGGSSSACTASASSSNWVSTPVIPKADYNDVVIADGPYAYYKLDDSSLVSQTDSSGNNRTLTGTVSQANITGINSTSKGIAVTGGQILNSSTNFPTAANGDYSIEAWVTFNGANHAFYVAGNGAFNGSCHYGSWMGFETTTKASSGSWMACGSAPMISMNKAFATNEWHHLVLSRTSGTNRFYVDGELAGSNTLTPYVGETWQRFSIGGTYAYSAYGVFKADNVAYYQKGLTAAQIQSHYNAR